jgi:hypothetical protein
MRRLSRRRRPLNWTLYYLIALVIFFFLFFKMPAAR